mgnify:CR=1 FL=1
MQYISFKPTTTRANESDHARSSCVVARIVRIIVLVPKLRSGVLRPIFFHFRISIVKFVFEITYPMAYCTTTSIIYIRTIIVRLC